MFEVDGLGKSSCHQVEYEGEPEPMIAEGVDENGVCGEKDQGGTNHGDDHSFGHCCANHDSIP